MTDNTGMALGFFILCAFTAILRPALGSWTAAACCTLPHVWAWVHLAGGDELDVFVWLFGIPLALVLGIARNQVSGRLA